jgi:HEPN domain-containing protein
MATEDFFSSALRHFEDSSRLHTMGRIDESAYLAGYVIECGLKKLLEVHRGTSARGYGHDLRGMTTQGLALAALLAPASARYRIDGIAALAPAMSYWGPDLRYRTSGDVTLSDASLMLEAARDIVRVVLVSLLLDGNERSLR